MNAIIEQTETEKAKELLYEKGRRKFSEDKQNKCKGKYDYGIFCSGYLNYKKKFKKTVDRNRKMV